MKHLLLIAGIAFSISTHSQRSQKPWHNHNNYKEEVIDAIKQSPQILYPELYLGNRSKKNPIKNQSNDKRTVTDDIDFVNGINIAWVNFGRDIGIDPEYGTEYRPDIDKFDEIMNAVADAGGNVIRWWYHTNGSTNPTFDENQMVSVNPDYFHEDVKEILDLAASKGLKIQICLWSFDMLKDQWNVDATANKKLIVEDVYFQSYVDNALIPLVNAIGDHPGLYAWEIFNEAEGMTDEYGSHWPGFAERVSIVDVQRFINKTTAAIRTAQPNVKVTNGALGFLTSLDDEEKGYQNMYSDEKLIEIGGKDNGYLDFYNIHFYNWAGENGSPFHNTPDPEKIDKPATIAEYYPDYTFGIDIESMGTILMDNGWKGSLLWSWTDRPWDIMETIIFNAANYTLSTSDRQSDVVEILPNPTNGLLYLNGFAEGTEIILLDPTGKIISQHLYDTNSKKIDITSLANGVYYVKLNNNTTQKILKY